MKKIGLFFGGLGNEAEVSIISAKNVADNFDHKKYKLVLVYWHTDGFFYHIKNFSEIKNPIKKIKETNFAKTFDVALPMTHGRYGEDGILQGIFERFGVQYCGCRVLSSALCMDKAVCKKYLEGQKIRQTKFAAIDLSTLDKYEAEKKITVIQKSFKLPIFVKPANSGSSVGITKVEKMSALKWAIKEASIHDQKIVIEEGVVGLREIEVGILGNNRLTVSRPGELVLSKEFYDYEDKYKKNKTEIKIPAKLSKKEEREIMMIAEKVYRLCDCRGFSRIDFFVAKNKIYLNEINTLPGFTQFSMYPMLMMNMGMSYRNLLNNIIELA